MQGSYWEEEFARSGILDVAERFDDPLVVEWMNSSLPWVGSGISWSKMDDHRESVVPSNGEWALPAMRLLEECGVELAPLQVYHVGDNLSPFDLRFAGNRFQTVCTLLQEIPEHHYFVPQGFEWCLCVRMTGDIDFGRVARTGPTA